MPVSLRVPTLIFLVACALGCAPARASLVETTGIANSTGGASIGSAPLAADPTSALAAQNMLAWVSLSVPLVTSGAVPLQTGNSYLVTPSGNFDLSLWSFVTTLGALQGNLPLNLAQGHIVNLLTTPTNSNVVPLPAAGWLFVSGLSVVVVALRKRRHSGPGRGRCPTAA